MSLKKDIVWRVGLIYAIFFLFTLTILGRVLYLQLVEGDKWRNLEQKLTLKDFIIEPNRGNIFDMHNRLLATSVPFYEIRMDLRSSPLTAEVFNKNIDSLAYYLARLFGDKTSFAYKKELITARRKGERYHLIKRRVTYIQLKELKNFPIFRRGRYKGGFIVIQNNRRVLPHHELAARTIGYTTRDASANVVGLEGAYDYNLRGRIGMRLKQKLSGNDWMPVNDKNEIEPKDGQDIITTIDINLQDLVHHALLKQLVKNNAHHGTAVVMEVKTGEIRAIVNLEKDKSGNYSELYNYAIGESTEPGSTFKLPVLMAALEDGVLHLTDTVDTRNGKVRFFDKIISDSHEGGYGVITAEEALEYSSNVGVSKLIYRDYHGKEKEFINRLYSMDLNRKLGLEIKGEGAPEIKYPGDPLWSGISLPMISHGYEVRLTPLQILTFYNAVANNGEMVKPIFVREIRYHGKLIKKFPVEVINPSIASHRTIKEAQKMLEGVVEVGTAKNLRNKNYKIAGKTGTAQIADKNKGYGDYRSVQYQASFVGYFPADHPKYSCIVVVNAPSNSVYYGNLVAGPVFKEIADRIYATELDLSDHTYLAEYVKRALPYSKNGNKDDLEEVLRNIQVPAKPENKKIRWVVTYSTDSLILMKPLKMQKGLIPNVVEMGLEDAVYLLSNRGLKVQARGFGKVRSQSILPGTRCMQGAQIVLEMSFIQPE